ncbi:MAG: class I SAM-dependent methyltransferase [Planctomycetaceae bacterium]|nr:class I SAM-dependent methyltransferase [Planctomycetaceae bacterium]
MSTSTPKMTTDEIRVRFDAEVERFSNLQTGQTALMDAPLMLDLIADAAALTNPQAAVACDLGCGAGNYTLKLLARLPNLQMTMIDLSQVMLEKAQERVSAVAKHPVTLVQQDMREVDFGTERYDILMAAATLHHLRTDEEWRLVFQNIFNSLKPGGSFWICDLIDDTTLAVTKQMWNRWSEYLLNLNGAAYRDDVLDYVDREDTPKPLMWQIDLLKSVGFNTIEILHKNACFAAFGAIKS